MSLNVVNFLPHLRYVRCAHAISLFLLTVLHLRYRTSNLLLVGIIPGPTEANPEEVQKYLRVLVNELLRLWKIGFYVRTRKYPLGRLVRLILVGVICDKPAAHKIGGYGSHSHRHFCTQCWIEQKDKVTEAAFTEDGVPFIPRHSVSIVECSDPCTPGFAPRTDTQHRDLQRKFEELLTKTARKDFVKEFATRYSELSRLPYFDFRRMIVIDPMHNLFLGESYVQCRTIPCSGICCLGLIKTHFYHIWIQGKVLRAKKELRRLHAILAEVPLSAVIFSCLSKRL